MRMGVGKSMNQSQIGIKASGLNEFDSNDGSHLLASELNVQGHQIKQIFKVKQDKDVEHLVDLYNENADEESGGSSENS